MHSSPSHVAVLVPSVRKAAEVLRRQGYEIGEVESFEETVEIYVQGGERNSLLLMEPKETGSYRRALEKRGPGVHHLAIDVPELDPFLASLAGSGWLLHLNSLRTIPKLRTAYLARPGFPALIEVQEKKAAASEAWFVEEVQLPFGPGAEGLVRAIGLQLLVRPAEGGAALKVRGGLLRLESLL